MTPSQSPTSAPTPAPLADFELTSTAFADGEAIPVEYTCDGADRQLPLAWTGTPEGTAELALIFKDPDAGGFVHWVVFAIPADATELGDPLPPGAGEGMTDFGQAGYRGPCPPAKHTYKLTLYALLAPLGLSGQPSEAEVRQAATDKTIATAVLTGTYRRP